MGSSNGSFLSFKVIFHFHDYGRKSLNQAFSPVDQLIFVLVLGAKVGAGSIRSIPLLGVFFFIEVLVFSL